MNPLLPVQGVDLDLSAPPLERFPAELAASGVQLNDSARNLLAHPGLRHDIPVSGNVRVVECTLSDLGLAEGGTLPQLIAALQAAGLAPCPPLGRV